MAAVDTDLRHRLAEVERQLRDYNAELHVDGLLDSLQALVDDCNFPAIKRSKTLKVSLIDMRNQLNASKNCA
jgi:hypothetical protein